MRRCWTTAGLLGLRMRWERAFPPASTRFCVLVDHFLQCSYPHYKVTHCVFNNVGAHGSGPSEANRRLFRSRLALVKPCLDELGLPLLWIDSNLTEVLKLGFQ